MRDTTDAQARPPHFGTILRALLERAGYWRPDGHPDVGRFCREKGYLPQSVYAWLGRAQPRLWAIQKLAADLGATAAEILGLPEPGNPSRPPRPGKPRGSTRRRSRGEA